MSPGLAGGGDGRGHLAGLGPVGGDVGDGAGQSGDDGHGQDGHRTRRSRKVVSPMATSRMSGMNTTDA